MKALVVVGDILCALCPSLNVQLVSISLAFWGCKDRVARIVSLTVMSVSANSIYLGRFYGKLYLFNGDFIGLVIMGKFPTLLNVNYCNCHYYYSN